MKRLVFVGIFIGMACLRTLAQAPPPRDTSLRTGIRIDSSLVSDRMPIFRRLNRYLYTPERAASIVSVIGEPDVLRQIATLPGVASGIEGSLGLFVRGGNAGNSRIEYDGVPVYGTSHLVGLFSSFSPDMISLTDFRAGGFEASSGNATSSLMRINSKSGKVESSSWNISISPYMTSAYLEAQGKHRKTIYRVAGRFSPLPLIARMVTRSNDEYAGVDGLMHDWAATIESEINERSVIKMTGLFSQDRLSVRFDESGSLTQNISGMVKLDFKSSVSEKTRLDAFGYLTRSNVRQTQDYYKKVDLTLTDRLGAEMAMDRTSQYLHVLEGLPSGWALNIMTPAGEEFRPETSRQIYTGLFWRKSTLLKLMGKTEFHLNAGCYTRSMTGMISYKSSINMFRITDDTWENEVESGSGRSAGVEVSGSMSSQRLSMNIAYTLSRTDRKYASINDGERFPFKFDRPHILNIQSDIMVSKRKRGEQHLGLVVSYSSGNLMTVQTSQYPDVLPPYWDRGLGSIYTDKFQDNIYDRMEMTSVNGHRMKDYFRLDVAYTFRLLRKRSTHDLTVSVFNVTNRHNPYIIYNDYGTWKQISIIPVMPSLRWSVKF